MAMHCVIPPRSALPVLFLALGLGAGACGGAEVPTHDGYNSARPWAKAKPLELDSTGEADVDDAISYPRKVRARWYQLELPTAGEIAAELELVTLGTDELPAVDFEVLDAGYNVLMSTRPDGNDETLDAQPEKQLSLMELSPGTYYLHVYTMERTAQARYNLRVKFSAGMLADESSFPEQVAYVPPLPIVPAFDDAPPPEPRRRTGRRTTTTTKTTTPPAAEARTVRILGAVASGNGTRITLSVGSSDGVGAGWKGNVVTTSGAVVGNGGFTIDSVTANRSNATVSLPRDQVLAAKRARISPP
jgi:hypothetical protein